MNEKPRFRVLRVFRDGNNPRKGRSVKVTPCQTLAEAEAVFAKQRACDTTVKMVLERRVERPRRSYIRGFSWHWLPLQETRDVKRK